MDSSQLAALTDVSTIAEQANIYRYTAVATLTVLVYEYICTLEDEIRLVWPSRWSFIKYVYFLNRAVAFVAAFLLVYLLLEITDKELCKRSLYSTALMAQMTFVIGEIVLFMRVYALWFCDRRMLIFLTTVYLSGVTGSTYATVHATSSAFTTTFPQIFGAGCLLTYTSGEFWICYLVLLLHETFMLFLILTRAYLTCGSSLSNILHIVVRDGIFYYLCVLGTSVANLLVLLLATKNLRTLLILTQGVIHSILCARLLLRLRGAYRSLTAEGLRSVRVPTQATSLTLVSNSHQGEEIPLHTFSSSANTLS